MVWKGEGWGAGCGTATGAVGWCARWGGRAEPGDRGGVKLGPCRWVVGAGAWAGIVGWVARE